MPNTAENQDIAFQPTSKGYSYSNSEMSGQRSNEKKRGKFFMLVIEIFGLLFLFFMFLAVLNYYSIISLSSINPALFDWLPNIQTQNNTQKMFDKKTTEKIPAQKTFDEQTGVWKTNGTLYSFSDNKMEIKSGEEIIKLEFLSANSMFYKQTSISSGGTTPSTTNQNIPYTLFDLDQRVNLGKKVEVFYTKDNSGKNIIQTITMLN